MHRDFIFNWSVLHGSLLALHLVGVTLCILGFCLGLLFLRHKKRHQLFNLVYTYSGMFAVSVTVVMAVLGLVFIEFGVHSESFMARIAQRIGYPQGPLAGYSLGLLPGFLFVFCCNELLHLQQKIKLRCYLVVRAITGVVLLALILLAIATFHLEFWSIYLSRGFLFFYLLLGFILSKKITFRLRHALWGLVSFLIFIETGLQGPTRHFAFRYFYQDQLWVHLGAKIAGVALIVWLWNFLRSRTP